MTKAGDVIKDNIDKPLIVVRTEDWFLTLLKECENIKSHKYPLIDSKGFVGSVDESDLFQVTLPISVADKPSKKLWVNLFLS